MVGLLFGAIVLVALAVISFAVDILAAGVVFLFGGLYTVASAVSYLYTTRRGEFAVWAEELQRLGGDERLLDLGCGRGAVLLLAAERLDTGRATGVDLWPGSGGRGQSANGQSATRSNAVAEGVEDRVELVTGDLRDLPFGDDAFDVVVSSLAIHKIHDAEGRERIIREAHRVLRPGGLMLIADSRHAPAYESALRGLGVVDVRHRDAGWRFWHGGPWFRTDILEARKPS